MGIKNRDGNFWESALMNKATLAQYLDRLTELAVSMFEWKGLPETIDPCILELWLFTYGSVAFFNDEAGYLALPATFHGKFNYNGIPKKRRAYSPYNGFSRSLDEKNSVLIYNNMLRKNSIRDVQIYAKRLYKYDRIIDTNVNAQKTPLLVACDENERLAMKNVYKMYEGNEPVIFGTKALNPNAIKVLSTNAPFVADKIYDLRTQIWNEILTHLGISNINNVKKERMITDEVTRNLGGTVASRYSRLNMRKNACKQINAMFPELHVECDYREDYNLIPDDFDESEGEDNG